MSRLSGIPRLVRLVLVLLVSLGESRAAAAQLRSAPASPQPGDVLTLTVTRDPGERITAVRMNAFDTPDVKFYPRPDGSFRAFLGFPFDRSGGAFTLRAVAAVTGPDEPGEAQPGQAQPEQPAPQSQEGSQSRAEPLQAPGPEREEPLVAVIHARARLFPTQNVHMKPSTAKRMSNRAAFRREKQFVQAAMQDSAPRPLWTGAWIVPAPGVSTSSYGRRRTVNGHPWGQHNGADIRAGVGTPVHATNTGRVVLSEYLPTLRGNCIVVDHGCNVYSVYMHLSRRLVAVGEQVTRGQLIGRVGATGFVTGPHLHWEIRIGWEPVDPFRVAARGLQFYGLTPRTPHPAGSG